MNKRIKTRWLKALRSGKYKQGRYALRTKSDNGFCCLGVLCDLYTKSPEGKKKKARWILGIGDNKYSLEVNRRNTYVGLLPIEVMKWANIGSDNPILDSETGNNTIDGHASYWNDNRRVGFRGIANRIEHSL